MPIPLKIFPVTLHLGTTDITVQYTDQRIRQVVSIANQIWEPASISLSIRCIQPRVVNPPPGSGSHINDTIFFFLQHEVRDVSQQTVKVALTGQTSHNLHAGKATINGRFCLLPWGPGGETNGTRGKVLAHELGHLMGLEDFRGAVITPRMSTSDQLDITQNLMASHVSAGTRLRQEQRIAVGRSPLSRL